MLFPNGMNKATNIWLTVFVIFGCYLVSVLMPSINDALTLIGSTTNPLVGFIFPIMFYLKMTPKVTAKEKFYCYSILALTILVSMGILIQFFHEKLVQ